MSPPRVYVLPIVHGVLAGLHNAIVVLMEDVQRQWGRALEDRHERAKADARAAAVRSAGAN